MTLGGVASSVALTSSLQTKAAKDKPNFIIIYTDDQGYGDLGATATLASKHHILIKWLKKG